MCRKHFTNNSVSYTVQHHYTEVNVLKSFFQLCRSSDGGSAHLCFESNFYGLSLWSNETHFRSSTECVSMFEEDTQFGQNMSSIKYILSQIESEERLCSHSQTSRGVSDISLCSSRTWAECPFMCICWTRVRKFTCDCYIDHIYMHTDVVQLCKHWIFIYICLFKMKDWFQ